MRQGPFADRYPGAVALVVLALVPFLLLTAAIFPLSSEIAKGVGLSPHALDLTIALADAGYAFGTMLAVQLAVHLPPRRLLLVYVTLFVIASALSAWAPAPGVFEGAVVVQGLCTSLMLIAAVPQLVTGWPVSKMPTTGAVMNLCIFGAVAIGPTVGSLQAAGHGWRPLFIGVAVLGALALVVSVLTFKDQPPADPSAPWDPLALALAGVGCAAAFFGAGELEATKRADATALVPLIGGLVAIVSLVVYQYRKKNALIPVEQLATTFPVAGLVVAMAASAAAVGLMELLLSVLQTTASPARAAVLFLPEFAAAVATAALFGALFKTRFTPLLALGGTIMLTAAAAVSVGAVSNGGSVATAVSSGLIGLGVGASVSPALFIAGFSLRSAQIQRVFALIELLRGVTAFLVAPVLIYLSTVFGGSKVGGIRDAVWICLGISAAGGLVTTAVFVLGGGRLQIPDLERWQEHGEPAWVSPPLLARLSGRPASEGAFGARPDRAPAREA
ncbi:MAG: Drug resistance transporter EmrB/QacA subfamily [Acidimicrobiaceae bacterium]|nr:Drug resistance transporter EmrB/QacA subfamily [Acidimicrobiaceae bacterium]